MRIFGLNVGGNSANHNGRGWIEPATLNFQYVPIADIEEQATPLTYRDIGLTDVKYPHLPVHYDPEFDTFTYGHAWRGWGDQQLRDMKRGEILFFYSTLDLLPDRTRWGLFIIGFFVIHSIVNTTNMTPEDIQRLPGFENNAHLRHKSPKAHLLVKGSAESRLYKRAIPLSDPEDNRRIHPSLRGLLVTAGGVVVEGGSGWYRWLLCSQDQRFAEIVRENL